MTTAAATLVMLLQPACGEHVLAEVVRGLFAGLLNAGVKVLVLVSGPRMVCQPVSCWLRFASQTALKELQSGLVSGYLLGLSIAMWACWIG